MQVLCDTCNKTESEKWRSYRDIVKNEKGELVEYEFHFCSLECFQKFVKDLKEEKVKVGQEKGKKNG